MNEVLMQNLLDVANSWDLMADGEYLRSTSSSSELGPANNAHEYFLNHESLSGKGGGGPVSKPHRQRESDL